VGQWICSALIDAGKSFGSELLALSVVLLSVGSLLLFCVTLSVNIFIGISLLGSMIFSELLDAGQCFCIDMKGRAHLEDLGIDGRILQAVLGTTNRRLSFHSIA
jgi:hypothetical protein